MTKTEILELLLQLVDSAIRKEQLARDIYRSYFDPLTFKDNIHRELRKELRKESKSDGTTPHTQA